MTHTPPTWCTDPACSFIHLQTNLCLGVTTVCDTWHARHPDSEPPMGAFPCTGSAHTVGVHARCTCACHHTSSYVITDPGSVTVSCDGRVVQTFTLDAWPYTCEDAHNFADAWNHAYPPPTYPTFHVDPHYPCAFAEEIEETTDG
jgi:hypothetical protein